MADRGQKDRLSPPLMYAFREAHAKRDAKKAIDERDADGQRILASRRQTGRPITEQTLRQEVERDVEALLNTIAFSSRVDLADQEHVRASVLNYGLPDIVERTFDETAVDDIANEIKTALETFEPRLVADSIDVNRDTSIDPAELRVRFVVRAELRCEPANVGVQFVTDLELDTGEISVDR